MYGSLSNSEEIKSTNANYAATILQDKIRWSLHISKVPTAHKESQNAWLFFMFLFFKLNVNINDYFH